MEILFNATEPGKTTGLTMAQLVLKIYDPTGTLLLVETLVPPGLKLSPTVEGNGRFDYSFGLNAAGIASLNTNLLAPPAGSVKCQNLARCSSSPAV